MELLDYTDLLAAGLNLVLLVAIVLIVRRRGLLRTHLAVGLIAFFALRVLSRLNDSPEVLFQDNPMLELVLDVLSVVVLAYLLTQVARVDRILTAMLDEARFRTQEYDRAKRHYTQVVRHRLLNPVAVVKGSAQTLKADLGLEERVRAQICDAIIAMADEIQDISLNPERRDALEHDLDAIPRVEPEVPPGS